MGIYREWMEIGYPNKEWSGSRKNETMEGNQKLDNKWNKMRYAYQESKRWTLK